jgi:hypothetical protein
MSAIQELTSRCYPIQKATAERQQKKQIKQQPLIVTRSPHTYPSCFSSKTAHASKHRPSKQLKDFTLESFHLHNNNQLQTHEKSSHRGPTTTKQK